MGKIQNGFSNATIVPPLGYITPLGPLHHVLSLLEPLVILFQFSKFFPFYLHEIENGDVKFIKWHQTWLGVSLAYFYLSIYTFSHLGIFTYFISSFFWMNIWHPPSPPRARIFIYLNLDTPAPITHSVRDLSCYKSVWAWMQQWVLLHYLYLYMLPWCVVLLSVHGCCTAVTLCSATHTNSD